MALNQIIKLRYILPAIFIFIIYGIVSLVLKLGVFKPVTVEIFDSPNMVLLYKVHTGAYHKISPVIEEVEAFARKNNLQCKSFGEFFDDPRVVEEIRLKSFAGCLITQGEFKPESLPAGYIQEVRPGRKYVKATFAGSPAISPYKVYPKIQEFAAQSRLTLSSSIIEIYLPNENNKTGLTDYLWGAE